MEVLTQRQAALRLSRRGRRAAPGQGGKRLHALLAALLCLGKLAAWEGKPARAAGDARARTSRAWRAPAWGHARTARGLLPRSTSLSAVLAARQGGREESGFPARLLRFLLVALGQPRLWTAQRRRVSLSKLKL